MPETINNTLPDQIMDAFVRENLSPRTASGIARATGLSAEAVRDYLERQPNLFTEVDAIGNQTLYAPRKVNWHEQWRRQLSYLRQASDLYDTGEVNVEVITFMATALRVLFYDSKKRPSATSLVTRLAPRHLQLLSTNTLPASKATFWPGLAVITLDPIGERFEMTPKLATARDQRFVDFDLWWRREIIFVYPSGNAVVEKTRNDLVLGASTLVNGGNVDPKDLDDYEALAAGAEWKLTLNLDDTPSKELPLKNAHFATLRQIAYEVLNSPDAWKIIGERQ